MIIFISPFPAMPSKSISPPPLSFNNSQNPVCIAHILTGMGPFTGLWST